MNYNEQITNIKKLIDDIEITCEKEFMGKWVIATVGKIKNDIFRNKKYQFIPFKVEHIRFKSASQISDDFLSELVFCGKDETGKMRIQTFEIENLENINVFNDRDAAYLYTMLLDK